MREAKPGRNWLISREAHLLPGTAPLRGRGPTLGIASGAVHPVLNRRIAMPNDVAIAATHEIETSDLEYRRADEGPLLARLYQPKGKGPFPALIDGHGAAWASGDLLNNAPLGIHAAPAGILALSVEFRSP